MSGNKRIWALMQAAVLGISLALPACAQETGGTSASTSMHQAGEDTESAAKNAYHGTATALDDTRITTEVKTALAMAKDLRSGQIHVATTASVVTLEGTVHDSAIVSRAEAIAKSADGVRAVKNDLQVSSSVPKD
jgi:hyperosmotically inducible protein